MRPEVQHDYSFGRLYLDEMKGIAGRYLIGEAPYEDDTERGTDLIVLKLDAVRIACRVRRAHYLSRYADEFTIRAGRPSGTETELAKILAGWGDYFIYGFAGEEGRLAAWLLGDLHVFRRWFSHELVRLGAGQLPGAEQSNHDGSSTFRAFRIADLPDAFVIARACGTVRAATSLDAVDGDRPLDIAWERAKVPSNG